MHDDLLERRLRAALLAEADHLPFTITHVELERRSARRGRPGTRRLTLLVAAAISIGGLGVGGLIAGLRTPDPSPSATAVVPTPAPTDSPSSGAGGSLLPSLDELIAQAPSGVLVASAHGPASGPDPADPFSVGQLSSLSSLGTIQGRGDYLITVACAGRASIVVAVLPADVPGQTVDGPRIACGLHRIEQHTVHIDGPAGVELLYRVPVSWRVAISATFAPASLPTVNPILPTLDPGSGDELLRVDGGQVHVGDPAWGLSGLLLTNLGDVPARRFYAVPVWCESGATVRVLFGATVGDPAVADTETQVACDGQIHLLSFELHRSTGTTVAVAATPGARWSLVVMGGS